MIMPNLPAFSKEGDGIFFLGLRLFQSAFQSKSRLRLVGTFIRIRTWKKIQWNHQSISVTYECWIFMTYSQCHFIGEILLKYFLQHPLRMQVMCFCLCTDNLFFMKFSENENWSWWNWMVLPVFTFYWYWLVSGSEILVMSSQLLRRQRQWCRWCAPLYN